MLLVVFHGVLAISQGQTMSVSFETSDLFKDTRGQRFHLKTFKFALTWEITWSYWWNTIAFFFSCNILMLSKFLFLNIEIVLCLYGFINNLSGGNLVSLHSKEEADMILPFVRYNRWSTYIGLFRTFPKGKGLFICLFYLNSLV